MDIMIFAIPVFFILIGVELLVARLHDRQLYRFNDAVSNISCGLSQQAVGILTKAISLGAYAYLYYFFGNHIPNTWWTYLLLFVAIDGLYYWFHRYCHEISIFWGTHVVHHQSEEYNLSVALRQSAFQSLISGVFYLPLAIIGFDPIPFMLINTLQTLYQFWIHTETIDKLPAWFELIFNTPSHHRVHHGRNPKYIDKNHGGTLILFDRLFGTFQTEEEAVVYGVTKPLSTWNPIWANFDFYKDLGIEFLQTKGWKQRFKLLIEKPGWRSQENGGPQFPPAITRAKAFKYHTIIPNGLSIYIFLHYIIILGAATILLASAPKAASVYTLPILCSIGMVLWSVASLGLSADKKALGFWLEIARLICLPLILHLLFFSNLLTWASSSSYPNSLLEGLGLYATFGIVLISSVSLIYYWRFKTILIQ